MLLSGPVPETQLIRLARDLQDKIEALPGILNADIWGDREDLLEITVDPSVIETYGLQLDQVLNFVRSNNQLVAAGAIDNTAGRLVIKVPGVLEDVQDIMGLPLVTNGDRVVTFGDVATVRRTFKDTGAYVRLNGQPAIALDVSKRIGANIINTIATVRQLVESERQHWPANIKVSYMQDKSQEIRDMLWDLQNNILSAVLLVMIVIVAFLGGRSSLLVGLAIPASFLAGILLLYLMGYSTNIVVLFSLILVVGMLVDGAIVVVELATRHLDEGMEPVAAYKEAAKRMAWPVASSTATTLVVFVPLLFWPGIIGQFMKYLPITVLATLGASLLVAIIIVPVVGSMMPGRHKTNTRRDFFDWLGERYAQLLDTVTDHPVRTLLLMLGILVGSYVSYGMFGRGVEFFPQIDSDHAQITVRARGDLSVDEKDALMRQVEKRLAGEPEIKNIYTRTGVGGGAGNSAGEDVIGTIMLELTNWQNRRPAVQVMADLRAKFNDLAGVVVEAAKQRSGPSGDKPIKLEVSSRFTDKLDPTVKLIRDTMNQLGGFIDVEDTRPLPGIEWRLEVDREAASRYGVNVALLGQTVQLVTQGLLVAKYRPDDTDEEVDIRVRFPREKRHLETLFNMRVPTANGAMPLRNFIHLEPAQKTSFIQRINSRRVQTVQADVAPGLLVNDQLLKLKKALQTKLTDPTVRVSFTGENEDQQEAASFLLNAFFVAIFCMLIILVTQFNSVYQSLLVLSAIVFSTAGVFIGLLLTHAPFGIVMCGIALIALAGIVVNNNIVLIDTYNEYRHKGLPPKEAIMTTGRLRLRPVLLTSVTTILGLLPMVFSLNVDFISRTVTHGAPSTQWWTQLSTSVAGGLAFATVLTLFLTPALLMLGERFFPHKTND